MLLVFHSSARVLTGLMVRVSDQYSDGLGFESQLDPGFFLWINSQSLNKEHNHEGHYCMETLIYIQVYCHHTIILQLSHEVTVTHFTIQNGETALDQASINGHHKVVELLLGAGANPNVQDKVKTVMHILMVLHAPLYSYYTISTLNIPVVPRPFPTVLHICIMMTATNLQCTNYMG